MLLDEKSAEEKQKRETRQQIRVGSDSGLRYAKDVEVSYL